MEEAVGSTKSPQLCNIIKMPKWNLPVSFLADQEERCGKCTASHSLCFDEKAETKFFRIKLRHALSNSLFNKWCWENWAERCKKVKLDHLLTPRTRLNSKWIKDLNIGLETIKLLEENIGSKISDISLSSIFFSDICPWTREIKNKQMKLHQTKKFCTAKETVYKMKIQPTEWKKIFANDISHKGLKFKICN